MIQNVNKVQLVGNLGNKPEIRTFDGGNTMARFSLATTDEYTNKKGEKVKDTQWHNIIAWGKIAEKCESMEKGNHVSVEGKIVNRNYVDKNGLKRYITEIVASDINIINHLK